MKLRHFEAKRYKSLKDLNLDVDNFLVLIGANNHGKSNFFSALELFLSGSTKEVSRETYFNREIDEPIQLTATFTDLSDKELEKLRPWTVNGSLTVRKEYTIGRDDKATVDYYALMQVPEEPWLNADFEDYSNRTIVSQLPLYVFLPSSGRITKDVYSNAVEKYIEANHDQISFRTELRRNPAGFKQVLDGYLPEIHLVPAVRDVAIETKTATASTLLGRLLALVVERIAQNNPSFQDLRKTLENVKGIIEGVAPGQKIAEIRQLEEKIKIELSSWNVGVDIGIQAPDPKTIFTLGTTISIDDGLPTDISQKGHGLQRALLFALIRIWASGILEPSDGERQRSAMFAFEEPELFLHPQISRLTYEALKRISAVDQVLICSHSPYFVSLEDYKNIVIVRKDVLLEGTKVFRVKEELFETNSEQKKRFNMIQFFNPDRNELFFSRKVVLTEGAAEKSSLPLLAKRIGVYDHRVSIIDCNSKFNLTLYMRVLNAFQVPYLVIHDEDPVDPDLQPGMPNYNQQRLHDANHAYLENSVIANAVGSTVGKVHMVSPDFEALLEISRNRIGAVGKPYAAVEKYINEQVPIPTRLEQLTRLAFS